jgi:S1-C subfamily serine protease
MDDLLEYGKVQRGFIGVSIRDIDSKFADDKGIKKLKGVYVNGLTEGGAAAGAGIKEGDIITKVGDVEVNSSNELQEQIGKFRPGDKVNVTIERSGQEKIVAVVLRNFQGGTKVEKEENVNMLGATFSNITDTERKTLGITSGVKIQSLEQGKLRGAGIKEGFIITSIDNKKVSSPSEVATILNTKQGGVLIEGVYPNGMRAYYGFGL